MFCIVANVKTDKALRTGAKVYLLSANQSAESVEVTGISKGGRRINKHIPYKRLTNFRAAFVPPHMQEGKAPWAYTVGCWWEDKTAAQEVANKLNEIWKGVRYFSKDGERLMEDGITTGMAYKRARKMGVADKYACNCIPMDFMVTGHYTHTRARTKA
jgi:hypothetical protein